LYERRRSGWRGDRFTLDRGARIARPGRARRAEAGATIKQVKKSVLLWYSAREMYELVTAEGAVFTMFSASLRVDPNNTIDKLPTLGERLSLPAGWKFRVRKLEKELVLKATYDADPPNTIVLDQFENNYQRNRQAEQRCRRAAEPALLSDGINAKLKRLTICTRRAIELFLAGRDAKPEKWWPPANTMMTDRAFRLRDPLRRRWSVARPGPDQAGARLARCQFEWPETWQLVEVIKAKSVLRIPWLVPSCPRQVALAQPTLQADDHRTQERSGWNKVPP
jgi:hypothetical protein